MREEYKLTKWIVVTDSGGYPVTEGQKDAILRADTMKARFVEVEGKVFNLAFIKEIYRKSETRFGHIQESEKKFLIENLKEING